MKRFLAFLLALGAVGRLFAGDIDLPAPQKTGGIPLMEALARRATGRTFESRDLSAQQLANLLWSGFGVNRPDGRRTAPSASNYQEIEIYALLQSGAYAYDAARHRLRQITAEDLRSLGGKPEAPVTLIYVADLSKRTTGTVESKRAVACIDSGFISENIYLFCASEGLATGYRGGFDAKALPPKLNLRPDQALIAAQSVGYPKP